MSLRLGHSSCSSGSGLHHKDFNALNIFKYPLWMDSLLHPFAIDDHKPYTIFGPLYHLGKVAKTVHCGSTETSETMFQGKAAIPEVFRPVSPGEITSPLFCQGFGFAPS